MSSDPQNTSFNSNTPAHNLNEINGVKSLEDALAGINSVLSREGNELSERDMARLLKELDAAEGVADDVEGKLDELLKNLGGIIGDLETGPQEGGVPEAASRATSGEKHP